MKTEFICVQPKNSKAKNQFVNLMYGLHSCRVEKRNNGQVLLSSITGKYSFWMSESSDDNWEAIS